MKNSKVNKSNEIKNDNKDTDINDRQIDSKVIDIKDNKE